MHARPNRFRSPCILSFLALCLVCSVASALPFTQPGTDSAKSCSGQFLVRAFETSKIAVSVAAAAKTNQNWIWLDPTVVVVSAERIKQLVFHELGAGSSSRGKIFLALYPAESLHQSPVIVSWKQAGGWQYRVELPVIVERDHYLRAIVQVLLLEVANRGGPERSAEIPVWLVEGLSQQLLMSNEIDVLLATTRGGVNGPTFTSANVSRHRENPLERAQTNLKSHAPLSFEELSWPLLNQETGESGLVYRSSAQIFLYELLGLKEGRACLRTMLAELPHFYNWQLAFLKGFQAHFRSTADVEKWWALQVVHFSTRDALTQTWPFEESGLKLDQALHATVELHPATNDSPLLAEVPLQKVFREASRAQQIETVQLKIRELQLLRTRVADELVAPIDQYREVLENFLRRQPKFKFNPFRKGAEVRLAEETARILDQLDALRATLRPAQKPVVARKP